MITAAYCASAFILSTRAAFRLANPAFRSAIVPPLVRQRRAAGGCGDGDGVLKVAGFAEVRGSQQAIDCAVLWCVFVAYACLDDA
jgi:hypothetical protein